MELKLACFSFLAFSFKLAENKRMQSAIHSASALRLIKEGEFSRTEIR
jgi:hypothetical protein